MIHPIPSGTRDVLPDEMRELREITEVLRAVFDQAGYGEVYTPALEYEAVLARGDMADARPAYRVFDENGEVLVLRSDMTVPIARVVATRYPSAPVPLRFCYFAHSYRGVRPQRGQPREFLQAGIELIGSPAPDGTAEVLTVICTALDALGLESYRVGLGDAALYPSLLDGLDVPPDARTRLLEELARGDFVSLEEELGALELPPGAQELLRKVPRMRGGPDILHGPTGPVAEAMAGLRKVHALLEPAVAARVIFDLGLSLRSIGYYTGAIFEVYDPAVGMPLGGGGRYDDLLGRFGEAHPAVGFALAVDRLHMALAGEERGAAPGGAAPAPSPAPAPAPAPAAAAAAGRGPGGDAGR
ncbi:MAG: phosphoribosyltransferase regulatory subunit [Solirubrobacteraceae bacterium]|nr:phosphoribosyltransferase regulatory subunit [Solirubrobacteraceae bacterium]